MRVTNQGGSLAGFLIIGALLTLVLVGGLYGLNRYNNEKANTEVATSDGKPESKNSDAKDSKQDTDAKKTEETGRQTTPSGAPSSQRTQTPTATATPQQQSNSQSNSQLPQTGPADTAAMLAVIALVTFAGAHFIQSRQQ